MSWLSDYILGLAKRIDDLEARLANAQIIGKVAEVKGDKMRVKIAETNDGKPVLSPWVQIMQPAGSVAANIPLKAGDPCRLLSPNGEIGSSSIAVHDSHSNAAKNPAKKPEDLMLAYEGGAVLLNKEKISVTKGKKAAVILTDDKISLRFGDCGLELTDGRITISSGKAKLELTGDLAIEAAKVKHKGKNIGADHRHGGIEPGGGKTDTPS